MAEITDAAIREVYECHVLIQDWFAGHKDPTPLSLEPVLSKFANDFSMINPGGAMLGKSDLGAFLRNMHGARPGVKIDIAGMQVILSSDQCVILKYEELQHMEGKQLHRLSTAVFVPDAEGDVLWRHLQETWASS